MSNSYPIYDAKLSTITKDDITQYEVRVLSDENETATYVFTNENAAILFEKVVNALMEPDLDDIVSPSGDSQELAEIWYTKTKTAVRTLVDAGEILQRNAQSSSVIQLPLELESPKE